MLRYLHLLILLVLAFYSEAITMVQSYNECQSCIEEKGHIACRSSYNASISFCCDPNAEIECDYLKDPNFQFCSNMFYFLPALQPLACPYVEPVCHTMLAPKVNPYTKTVMPFH